MLGISLNPINWVTDAAGAVIDQASSAIVDAIVGWLEDGMRYVAGAVAGELAGWATVDLGGRTAQQMGGTFRWIALAVLVGSIMASAVMAAVSPQGSMGDTIREIPITLVLMAGWFGLVTVWVEATSALLGVWTTDALVEGLGGELMLEVGIASFVRGFVALMLIVFLIVFLIELMVLNHMLIFGVLLGQVAIALRPVRPLRNVSGQMIRNLVTLSLVPAMGTASLALSVGRLNDAGALSFGRALGALAGVVVSVLMPLAVSRFLPLGGQTNSAGRSLIGAAAQVAAVGAAAVAGAGAAAAGGGMSHWVSAATGSGGPGGGSMPGGGSGTSPGGGSGTSPGGGSGGGSLAASDGGGSGTTAAGDGPRPRPGGPDEADRAASPNARAPLAPASGRDAMAASAVAANVSNLFERGARE